MAILVSSAGAAPDVRSATIATFTDSTGEVAGAPDISTVTVSLEGDVLRVEAQVTEVPLMSQGALMFMLNTDSNSTTGGLRGADYVVFADLQTFAGAVMSWNGSDYVQAPKVADPTRTLLSGRSVGFEFNLANFGSPKHVELAVMVLKGAVEGGLLDFAPDSGLWPFDTVAAPPPPAPAPAPAPAPKPEVVKPVIGTPLIAPRAVIAGKRMTITFPVTRSTDSRPLTSGAMICDPSVAGKVLRHAESFTGGKARLSFLVPATAKGKLLRVKVTIRAGTQSATRIATFRVR